MSERPQSEGVVPAATGAVAQGWMECAGHVMQGLLLLSPEELSLRLVPVTGHTRVLTDLAHKAGGKAFPVPSAHT